MADSQIKIVGVGGAGCSAVESVMASDWSKECDLIAVHTDAMLLLRSKVPTKFLIGKTLIKGRSTGSNIRLGERAAMADATDLASLISGAGIVFIVAGLGGGTAAGASPVLASLAKSNKSLVVSFVTMPFKAEGRVCLENAAEGLKKLQPYSDLVIIVQTEKAFEMTQNLPLQEAFLRMNKILFESIESMIQVTGSGGLQAIRPLLHGFATIGVGRGGTVVEAAEKTLNNFLITEGVLDVSGIFLNVLARDSIIAKTVGDAVEYMSNQFNDAQIIWVSNTDESLRDRAEVVAVFTGLDIKI